MRHVDMVTPRFSTGTPRWKCHSHSGRLRMVKSRRPSIANSADILDRHLRREIANGRGMRDGGGDRTVASLPTYETSCPA
jgi:hypothetical protein